jgi:hypothetical protein
MPFGEDVAMFAPLIAHVGNVPLNGKVRFHNVLLLEKHAILQCRKPRVITLVVSTTYLSCVPQAGAGSFAPQAGAGSFAPQAGAGSFAPQAGAGSFVPQAEEIYSFAVIAVYLP